MMGDHRGNARVESRAAQHRISGLAQLLSFLACLAVLLSLPAAALAAEEETHLFSGALSLTGDCTTATLDPIPDPGCPGGTRPPSGGFARHGAVAVDLHGDRYVASGGGNEDGSEGRIDIFDAAGEFITEVPVVLPGENLVGTFASLAVDSQGYMYVGRQYHPDETQDLLRYKPTIYDPAAGKIVYGAPPTAIPCPEFAGKWLNSRFGLAINPANDHLFVAVEGSVMEFGSGAAANPYIEKPFGAADSSGAPEDDGIGVQARIVNIAIDAVRNRIFVPDIAPASGIPDTKTVIKVFQLEKPADPDGAGPEKAPSRPLLFTIDGSTTPTGRFVSESPFIPLVVDEATGHVFIGDVEGSKKRIYEFAESTPVSTIEHGFAATKTASVEFAYDNGPTSPTEGYLFVPSGGNPAHSYAFEPKPIPHQPVVGALALSGITADEAILHGEVDPKGQEASYRFEYTTEADFQAKGFEGAALAGAGTLKVASEAIAVSAPASGLLPGTAYRFRLVAESAQGEAQSDRVFATYLPPQIGSDCPNQALRTGPSSALPDCRAYELVTPADTNGHPPYGSPGYILRFPSRLSSPTGNALSFEANGGVIPGMEGTGNLNGDKYLSTRGPDGWQTIGGGPSGAFSERIDLGSTSPDQGYFAWASSGAEVPAAIEGKNTSYLRYPDGHSEPLGQGSLGVEPEARVELVTENASHVIFSTSGTKDARRLELAAPADGTGAIYDRTPDGTVHVVSLLPGDLTPAPGEEAIFKGASLDGEGVAFTIGGTLYLRYRNEVTHAFGPGTAFAGIAEGGARLFYLQGGDLYRFDAQTSGTTPFSESADVTVVNVAAGGTAAYLLSPSVLTGQANPEGDTAQEGARNLYLSREGQISFVATVSQRDVDGEGPLLNEVRGLGLWVLAAGEGGRFARDPSRTTSDGGVLLFESNARLTDYNPEGHTQVYRYDADLGTLSCLSCNPTMTPPTGEADLQLFDLEVTAGFPVPFLSQYDRVHNLSDDGARAFFESTEALVLGDTDGLRDVYEWEGEGTGTCQTPGGCLYLISSGQSGHQANLYEATDSGDDVFFRTTDLLVSADPDETPSIYDARVGGGFAPPQGPAGECLGEACQPAAAAPSDPSPASSSFQGAGNVREEKARGHKKKHRKAKHKHHKRANAKRRAGR